MKFGKCSNYNSECVGPSDVSVPIVSLMTRNRRAIHALGEGKNRKHHMKLWVYADKIVIMYSGSMHDLYEIKNNERRMLNECASGNIVREGR